MPVKSRTPKTTKEAMTMVQRGWTFLLKRNPTIFAPLTLWMLFGGFIFIYKYVDADTFEVKEAKPISQVVTPFSIVPQAFAEDKNAWGVPIIFNNQIWGYEDTTLIAKVDKTRPILLVYDKIAKKVYEVEFHGSDYKTQLKRGK
jgi:hypothetical protein